MWADDGEACRTIMAMLRRTGVARLWTAEGPVEEAVELLKAGGGPLSHGEAVMLKVAFDLWNGEGKATVDDLVSVLDDKNLSAVLTALQVARPGARAERSM